MKLILSRKGFDSSYGGYPSPVLPDGRMISLPIPFSESELSYKNIRYDGKKTYADLMEKIFGKTANIKWKEKEKVYKREIDKAFCHLDPDLNEKALRNRNKNWRPLFGQVGIASSHLSKKRVKKDDLFLFFGWFQKTKGNGKLLQFDKTEYPDGFHAIYGYLKIGEIVGKKDELKTWMKYHPHAKWWDVKGNTIYVAAKGGTFAFQDDLILTKKGETCRTHWNLRRDVFKDVNMSYNNKNSWKENYFLAARRGQEFVVEENAKVTEWAEKLIKDHTGKSAAAYSEVSIMRLSE